jgi:hypothetical protein
MPMKVQGLEAVQPIPRIQPGHLVPSLGESVHELGLGNHVCEGGIVQQLRPAIGCQKTGIGHGALYITHQLLWRRRHPGALVEPDVSPRFGHPRVLAHRLLLVLRKGGDGLGEDRIKAVIGKRQAQGICSAELYLPLEALALKAPSGPFHHLVRKVHAGDLATISPRQIAGCEPHAAAHLEHVRSRADVAQGSQLVRGFQASHVFGDTPGSLGAEVGELWL